ncbi:hypothetical protein M0805_002469 [Coniferiporia weirii]|nr:hypothetical protein M0805_002469 [Coniferiporia weirii]
MYPQNYIVLFMLLCCASCRLYSESNSYSDSYVSGSSVTTSTNINTLTSGSLSPSPSSGITGNSTSSGNTTTVSGSGNFAGSNLYYAAGLSSDQRKTYLSALTDANMKVLRVWLDGQSTGSTEGTTITTYPSLEPNAIGQYDDTVLNNLDDFMLDANSYGIKLQISIHSFNALSAKDVYGAKYGTSNFYTDSTAQAAFDARIAHVLAHQHKSLGRPWSDLGEYIFAFEAQNEAMIGNGQSFVEAHQSWQCDRAKAIKTALGGNSTILVTTGGESWLDESMQSGYFTCASFDILAIHAYGSGDFDTGKIQAYVQKATSAGKKLLFQEWCVAPPTLPHGVLRISDSSCLL